LRLSLESLNDMQPRKAGSVALVGSGPGDPELLTLKALKALQSAEVILFDNLVSNEVLALAPPDIRRVRVGKKGYGASCRQEDINGLMVALATSGWKVVRLKAGDPLVFGRAEEEIAALEEAGIAYEIVPGITAAQGAAARLKVPLTRRGSARRFQLITGHAANGGGLPEDFDWAGLADARALTAVYMPKATIRPLCAELMARGLPPHHPTVAVFDATRSSESIIAATLTTLPALLDAEGRDAPCIVLIGTMHRGENACPHALRGADENSSNAHSMGI
jgi:uroporphyrin-III C-methyltransferase / precorrin-2 dehydrogenase / sirohydrochlorin ferrochelatase